MGLCAQVSKCVKRTVRASFIVCKIHRIGWRKKFLILPFSGNCLATSCASRWTKRAKTKHNFNVITMKWSGIRMKNDTESRMFFRFDNKVYSKRLRKLYLLVLSMFSFILFFFFFLFCVIYPSAYFYEIHVSIRFDARLIFVENAFVHVFRSKYEAKQFNIRYDF